MIYFVYCFSHFINDEKVVSPEKEQIKEIDKKSIKNLNYLTKDTLGFSLEKSDDFIEPKPIVSSAPRPIVIDSNLVSKKNEDIIKTNSKLLAINNPIKTDDNEKIKSTLNLNEMMICRGIYKRNSIKPGIKFINNVDSLFCYTKISNSGSKQEVKHIWYFENKEVTTVSYNIKTSYNYRSWSKKTIYPNQTGKWRVDVVSKFGDILGSRDFTVNSISTTY